QSSFRHSCLQGFPPTSVLLNPLSVRSPSSLPILMLESNIGWPHAIPVERNLPLGCEANLHQARCAAQTCSKSTQASSVSNPARGPSIDHRGPGGSSKPIGALPKDRSRRLLVRPETKLATVCSREPLTGMKPASRRLQRLQGLLEPAI